ncbi:hypothetical protein BJ742DRAFT_790639 [Cladochytrium replicatum]|nr:hypothetical protein BJ742DRAFT_790639 [Cladochytrium replicatum]
MFRTLIFLLLFASRVFGHGALTLPAPRYSPRFDNPDHTRNPLNMRTEFFPSVNEEEMLVCGGINSISESKIKATKVQVGQTLGVEWEMGFWTGAALHQGTVDIFLKVGSGSFEKVGKTINLNGLTTVEKTPHGTTIEIPSGLSDGTTLVLRWLWAGGVTPETYVNCADLVIAGSSGGEGNVGKGSQESTTTTEKATSTTITTTLSETSTSTSKSTSSSIADPKTAIYGGNHDLITTTMYALITTYTITITIPGYEDGDQGYNVPTSTPGRCRARYKS